MAEKNIYKVKAERQTKKFMKAARAFLATKLTGSPDGDVPEEFDISMMMLESYYKTFVQLDLQINEMDSIVIDGKYGPCLSPLCAARDKACVRLESLLKAMGMTLKSGKVLGTTDVKSKQSPLDVFLQKQNER